MKRVASKWVDLAVVLKPPAGYSVALAKHQAKHSLIQIPLRKKQRGQA